MLTVIVEYLMQSMSDVENKKNGVSMQVIYVVIWLVCVTYVYRIQLFHIKHSSSISSQVEMSVLSRSTILRALYSSWLNTFNDGFTEIDGTMLIVHLHLQILVIAFTTYTTYCV